jgi:hypothetical protein
MHCCPREPPGRDRRRRKRGTQGHRCGEEGSVKKIFDL